MKSQKYFEFINSVTLALMIISSAGWPLAIVFFYALKLNLFINILFNFKSIIKYTKNNFIDFLILAPAVWAAFLGYFNKNPGLYYEFKLYFIAPLCFLIIFRKITKDQFEKLHTIFLICAWIIIGFIALQLLPFHSTKLVQKLAASSHFLIQTFNGYMKMLFDQSASLFFITPYFLTRFLLKDKNYNPLTTLLLVTITLLTGRKAVIASCLLIMIILNFIQILKYRKFFAIYRSVIICLVSFFLYSLVYQTNLQSMKKMFMDGFKFQNNAVILDINSQIEPTYYEQISSDANGALVRKYQFVKLSEEIAKAPFFGHGLGYVIKNYTRSETIPWRFELTYLGVILNIGILGFIVFIFNYSINLYRALMSTNIPFLDLISVSIASMSYLLCSFTNPYIMSPMFLWIFFLPYALSRVQNISTRATVNN